MWAGRTVAVLASGPSMSLEAAEAVHAARLPAIATNETFRLAPWADALYGADDDWWRFRAQEALKFAGLKITGQEHAEFPQLLSLRRTGETGFDPDPACLRTGLNSGYAATHIAAQAGASRVLLLGVDMQGTHWHGPHPRPLRNTPPEGFVRMLERWATLAPELAARGVEVVNCSMGSALECFPKMPLRPALNGEV